MRLFRIFQVIIGPLFITTLLTLAILTSPSPEKQAEINKKAVLDRWATLLPPGSEEINPIGNGWVTFRFNGRKYLYQHAGTHCGHSAMVEIK